MKILNVKNRKENQINREVDGIVEVFKTLMRESFEHYVGEVSEEDFKELQKNISNWSLAVLDDPENEPELNIDIDFELDLF